MKCSILALLLCCCCIKEKKQEPPKRYPYKGQVITFQEWANAIAQKKRFDLGLPKQKNIHETIVSAPPDDMWLVDPKQTTLRQRSQMSESQPLLPKQNSLSIN